MRGGEREVERDGEGARRSEGERREREGKREREGSPRYMFIGTPLS